MQVISHQNLYWPLANHRIMGNRKWYNSNKSGTMHK